MIRAGLLLSALVSALPAASFAAWSQKEFLIGCTNGPTMTGNPEKDSARLGALDAAHFNALVGDNLNPPRDKARVKYLLGRLAASGRVKLFLTDASWDKDGLSSGFYPCVNGSPRHHGPEDRRLNCRYEEDYADRVASEYGGSPVFFSKAEKAALMGYYVADEPSAQTSPRPNVLDAVSWVNHLAERDTDHISLCILNPFYAPPGGGNSEYASVGDYRAYVRAYVASRSPIAAFDYYPLERNARGRQRDSYYLNHAVFAEECARALPRKQFWSAALSVEHHQCDERGRRITDYDSLTEANLRFQAHAPLLYGAKGIIWFTYQSMGGGSGCPGAGWYYEDRSAPTGPDASINPTVYARIQAINGELAAMGPALLGLSWVATVHGSARDPVSGETGLPTLDDSGAVRRLLPAQPLDSGCAVGVLQGPRAFFLLVLNKRRGPDDSLSQRISVTGKAGVKLFDASRGAWEDVVAPYDAKRDATTLTAGAGPAGLRLFRIAAIRPRTSQAQ